MKIFIPLPKERYRLKADLVKNVGYGNHAASILPEGTVFKIEKAVMNKVTKPTTSVRALLMIVPGRNDLTMVKFGGTASFGITVHFTIEELRDIDLALAENVP